MTFPNVWGKKAIEKALAYANYQWTAHAENVLHGLDADGIYVDTPDISWTGEQLNCGWWKVDEVNVGIPYSWGNASTIEEFEAGIRNGKYAGNVPEDKKRQVSHNTVGVDCSGLLTVCWELPMKIATRDIPLYASVVDHLDDIQQGDVFAKVGSHVMLFKEFADASKREVVIVDAIEVALHEFIPDKTFQVKGEEENKILHKDFMRCLGEYPDGETRKWESITEIIARTKPVLDKYVDLGYERIIVVAHGGVIRRYTGIGLIGHCAACEIEYSKDFVCHGWV